MMNRRNAGYVGLAVALVAAFLLERADAQRGPYPGSSDKAQQQSNVAGQFDYYAMVMSWSPTYCEDRGKGRREPQCEIRNGRRYAFVLHGLWPQHNKGWPQDCRTRERPYVDNRTITSMLDIMPSRGLIIHEYKKHGTCAGLGVDGYFRTARKLFQQVKVPPRYHDIGSAMFVSKDELTRDFIAANPGMKASNLAIACGGSGNRLREIRFCFSKSGELRDCGRNENRGRMCRSDRMYLPPVRISR